MGAKYGDQELHGLHRLREYFEYRPQRNLFRRDLNQSTDFHKGCRDQAGWDQIGETGTWEFAQKSRLSRCSRVVPPWL